MHWVSPSRTAAALLISSAHTSICSPCNGLPSRMGKSLAHWAIHNSSWKQSVFHSQVWYVNTSYCGNSSATLSCQSESGIDASSFKVTEARDESFQKYSLESKHANTHIHAQKSWDGVILATWLSSSSRWGCEDQISGFICLKSAFWKRANSCKLSTALLFAIKLWSSVRDLARLVARRAVLGRREPPVKQI